MFLLRSKKAKNLRLNDFIHLAKRVNCDDDLQEKIYQIADINEVDSFLSLSLIEVGDNFLKTDCTDTLSVHPDQDIMIICRAEIVLFISFVLGFLAFGIISVIWNFFAQFLS